MFVVADGVMEILSLSICIVTMDRIGRRILLSIMMLSAGIGLLASVVCNELANANQSN